MTTGRLRLALLVAVRAALLGGVAVLLLWTRGFTRWPQIYFMTGPSMEPTVRAREYFAATSPVRAPRRGMLVLFRYEDEDGVFHVLRRVAALPGDTIAMRDGRAIVNGRPADWPFRILVPAASRSALARAGDLYTWPDAVVPPDSVFLLSDTRDIIGWPDSRFLGPVATASLVAEARRIVWSPERGRLYRRIR